MITLTLSSGKHTLVCDFLMLSALLLSLNFRHFCLSLFHSETYNLKFVTILQNISPSWLNTCGLHCFFTDMIRRFKIFLRSHSCPLVTADCITISSGKKLRLFSSGTFFYLIDNTRQTNINIKYMDLQSSQIWAILPMSW